MWSEWDTLEKYQSRSHWFILTFFSGSIWCVKNGVTFNLPKNSRRCVILYESISDGMMSINFKATQVKLNFVQNYSSTSSVNDMSIEKIHIELEHPNKKISKRKLPFTLDQFTAKSGSTTFLLSDCVDRFRIGHSNERGEWMLSFPSENNIVKAKSSFQHHARLLYTWTSPDSNYRNQIDYIQIW